MGGKPSGEGPKNKGNRKLKATSLK
uniref:Uncharacterized protein n=1 Tax=Vitis vinifera TaxID=29760 RepID=F6H593_VITVI